MIEKWYSITETPLDISEGSVTFIVLLTWMMKQYIILIIELLDSFYVFRSSLNASTIVGIVEKYPTFNIQHLSFDGQFSIVFLLSSVWRTKIVTQSTIASNNFRSTKIIQRFFLCNLHRHRLDIPTCKFCWKGNGVVV